MNEKNRIADEMLEGVNGGRELSNADLMRSKTQAPGRSLKSKAANTGNPGQTTADTFEAACPQCNGATRIFTVHSGGRAIGTCGHLIDR
ncbi:MAG: hypothetical protein II497_05280 [Lachnospiraceae bacterium]|nr:hypothetical protein [Lachnospiraceae bacterium]